MNKIPIQAWSKLAHVSIGRVDAKSSFKYTSQGEKVPCFRCLYTEFFSQKIDAIPNLTSSPIFHLVVVAVIVVDDVSVDVVVVFNDISH